MKNKQTKKAEPRALMAEALEPRVLFSAAPTAPQDPPPTDDIPAPVQEIQIDGGIACDSGDCPPATIGAPVAAPQDDPQNADIPTPGQELQLDGGIVCDSNDCLSESLAALADSSISQWMQTGLSEAQAESLQNIRYEIVDLEDGRLAVTEGDVIRIDDDAAGLGWFIDQTPTDHSEFLLDEESGILFGAEPDSLDGVDLLSILAHEHGHILGLEHASEVNNVMRADFGEGMRLLPQLGQAHGSIAGSLSGLNYASVVAGPPTVSGTVFNDQNFDGTRQIADEDGIEGVIVTAYDADENIVFQTISDANGDYSGINAGGVPLRLEFTNVPTSFNSSTADTSFTADPNTVSSIAFLTDASQTTANLALYQPHNQAQLVTTCFVFGLPENHGNEAAIVAFTTGNPNNNDINNSANGAQITPLAFIDQVGSTYGVGQNTNNGDLFIGTFQKRGVEYVQIGGNRPSNVIFEIPGGTPLPGGAAPIFAQVGSDPTTHDANLDTDLTGLGLVGKAGLGDVEVSPDNSTVYTINLHDRTLYALDSGSGAQTGAFDILTEIGEAGNTGASTLGVNPEENLRPFALGFNEQDGLLYVGMVNNAQYVAGGGPGVPGSQYDANLGHTTGVAPTNAVSVNTAADTIQINGHGFVNGDVLTFSAGDIGGLTTTVAYHVVVVDANNFHLATTRANAAISANDIANANPPSAIIDLTSDGAAPDQFLLHIQDEDENASTDPHIQDNLRAIVYTFDPATGNFSAAPVANFSLNYERGEKVSNLPNSTDWDPWVDTPAEFRFRDNSNNQVDRGAMITTQPILTDIEFDSDGNMILGFRDRTADQFRDNPLGDFSGDLLLTSDGIVLEDNATTQGRADSGGDTIRLTPGGGSLFDVETHATSTNLENAEFFSNNFDGGRHQETFQGALAGIRGGSELYSTIMDPFRFQSGGVAPFDLSAGDRTGEPDTVPRFADALDGIELFNAGFGKANGLGDLEYLNNLEMEIGNRIWIDRDADGIQDADEVAVADVTLQLHDMTDPGNPVLVGTTTTNAAGEWYFNDSNVSYTDSGDPVGLRALTDYRVSIVASEFAAGGDLDGLRITQQNEHVLVTGTQQVTITEDFTSDTSQYRGQRFDVLSTVGANGGAGANGEKSDGKQVFLIDGNGNRVTTLSFAGGILHVDEDNTVILTPTGGQPLNVRNIEGEGTPILGSNTAINTTLGTPTGGSANITDNISNTRGHTFGRPGDFGYAGVTWGAARTDSVGVIEIDLATSGNGGWFGQGAPGNGNPLAAADLIPPQVQITTDGGVTWTTVPATNDYVSQLTGHLIGGGGQPNPSPAPTATFTLNTPVTGINGIRLIGPEGGSSGGGFLGVFELRVLVNTAAIPDSFNYEIVEDRRDSDASEVGTFGQTGYTGEILYTTKHDGHTDHSLDIGVIRNNLELKKYVVEGGQLYDNDTTVTAGQIHAALNVGDTVEYALITAHNQIGIAYDPGANFDPTRANSFNITSTGISLFDSTEPTSVSDAYDIVITDVVGDNSIDLVTGSIQVYRQEANGTITTLTLGTDYQLTESAAGGFVIEMGGTALLPELAGTRPDLSEANDVITEQSDPLEVDNACPKGFIVTYRGMLTGASNVGVDIPNTARVDYDDLPSFSSAIATLERATPGSQTRLTGVLGNEDDPAHIRRSGTPTTTPPTLFHIPRTDDPTRFNRALADQGLRLFGGSDIFVGFRYGEPGGPGTPGYPDPEEIDLPPLPVIPMYSGLVDPGTVLNIKIMGKGGEQLLNGEMTIVSDAGGNWLAKFPDLILSDQPHYIVIEQTRPTWNMDDDEHGYNLRTYFAAPITMSHSQVNPISVEAVMGRRGVYLGMEQLAKAGEGIFSNTDWRLGQHEFYSTSGIGGVQPW